MKRGKEGDGAHETPAVIPWRDYAGIAVIIILTFYAYSSALQGGFIWDDNNYVTENPLLTAPDGLWRIWTTAETYQYYPLVFTSFWAERRLWGLHPTGYHIVNVALHTLNALLVWRLLLRMKIPGAWMIGAVFAVHPVHVESVAWVTERKNVLSGLFYLLAMGCYLRFEEGRRWTWYGGSLLLFVMALLSKTVTASLPVALLLIRWFKGQRIGRKEIGLLIPFFSIGVVLGLTTAWLEVNRVGAEGRVWDLTFLQKFMLAGKVLVFYAEKLVWPVNLIFNYPRWKLDVNEWAQWGWLIGVGIAVWLVWRMKDQWGRGPAAALGFFIVTLGPVLGFLKVYPFYYSYVADHFQYLASLGVIMLVVGSATWKLDRELQLRTRWPRGAQEFLKLSLAMCILIALGVLTWQQGRIYKNSETLWQDTLRKNPDSFMAHDNLGILMAMRGEPDKAIGHIRQAVKLNPDNAASYNNLGLALQSQGQMEEAIRNYRQAVSINPDFSKAYYNLGLALQAQGRPEEAILNYRQALRVNPDFAMAYYNLGLSLQSVGRLEEAIGTYEHLLRNHPENPVLLYRLALALNQAGRVEEALIHLREAVRLNPDALGPLNNLAWILATNPDSKIRNGKEAVSLAQHASELTRHENPKILDTLAAAYAASGNFNRAVSTAQDAIEAAESAKTQDLADGIRKRLEQYRQSKPYLESGPE